MESHEYLCTACGSTDILKNSLSEWDTENQEWVEDDAFMLCSNCGSEDIIKKSLAEQIDLFKPIIQYGIHIIDVFYPSEFLEKEFNIVAKGLTIVFDRSTMDVIQTHGHESINYENVAEVVEHSKHFFERNNHE